VMVREFGNDDVQSVPISGTKGHYSVTIRHVANLASQGNGRKLKREPICHPTKMALIALDSADSLVADWAKRIGWVDLDGGIGGYGDCPDWTVALVDV
jgi:hypothetical protein